MAAQRKDPLRRLTKTEVEQLQHIARLQTESASRVAHAKVLLAVNEGLSYSAAAKASGRKSNDAVAHLVSRFNREGLNALNLHHGGGNPIVYDETKRKQIVSLAKTEPDRERDGTATWSLSTLQDALRKEKEFKSISTFTILKALHESGLSKQKGRTWVATGIAKRVRKDGVVEVIDVDTDVKKNSSKKRIR